MIDQQSGYYRYLYIIEDHKIVEQIQNDTTPKFKRIYNEEIFGVKEDFFKNSQVQLCISSNNVNKDKYIGKQMYIEYGERSGVNEVPFHIKETRIL